jgi:hypothetical protein
MLVLAGHEKQQLELVKHGGSCGLRVSNDWAEAAGNVIAAARQK